MDLAGPPYKSRLLKPIGEHADAERVQMRAVVVEDAVVVGVDEEAAAANFDEARGDVMRAAAHPTSAARPLHARSPTADVRSSAASPNSRHRA